MRALGVASASDGDAWRLLGLLPIFDPPREDSAETIKELMGGGVDVKMVTGDHAAIAAEIARRLGLGDRIVPADEAFHDHRPIDAAAIDAADGFAQVFPEHKFAIVEALQHAGHIVGMTGDGVNDAPALKHADVGIAVEGSTDAARAAADLVLTAPGLGVIARAIGESRCIFERMTAYATYRIAETTRVLLFLTASILIFRTYPVSAIMIVMLALLNDGPIMMVATDRAREADRPVRWSMGQVISIAAILGCVGVLFSFLLLWIGREVLALPAPEVQTLLFLKLAVGGHMTLYTARTGPDHFWRRPWPSPVLFWTVECTQVAATLVAIAGILMAAIPWWLALGVWGYGFAAFVVGDAVKVWGWRALRGRAAWGRSLIVLLNSPIHMAHATEVRERRGATRRDRESR
jgi:H+-transporting ATPase